MRLLDCYFLSFTLSEVVVYCVDIVIRSSRALTSSAVRSSYTDSWFVSNGVYLYVPGKVITSCWQLDHKFHWVFLYGFVVAFCQVWLCCEVCSESDVFAKLACTNFSFRRNRGLGSNWLLLRAMVVPQSELPVQRALLWAASRLLQQHIHFRCVLHRLVRITVLGHGLVSAVKRGNL